MEALITPNLVNPFLFRTAEALPFLADCTFLLILVFLVIALALMFLAGDFGATLEAVLATCF